LPKELSPLYPRRPLAAKRYMQVKRTTSVKFMKKLLYILLLLVIVSCKTNKNVFGTYRSKFITLGFFGTTIDLKKDSTFKYNFSGDLIDQNLTGKYSIRKNILYLKFKTNKGEREDASDSLQIREMFSGDFHDYDLKQESGIQFHRKYKIRGYKIFSYHIGTGKLVTRAKYYNGKTYKFRKYYLEKLP
jgi:hypothetical protein